MTMDEVQIYEKFFSEIPNFSIASKFDLNRVNGIIEGEIQAKISNSDLRFKIEIPEGYPLGDLRFIAKDFVGYPHQNFDGSLCLNTSFINNVHSRLKLEVEKLENYIKHYYENENTDAHFEYAAFEPKGNASLIFEEGSFQPDRFTSKFGQFKYSIISASQKENGKISQIAAIAQNLGNKEYKWSKIYKNKETYQGLWVFIDREPVHERRHRITNWNYLNELMPSDFHDYFRNFCKNQADYKLYPKGFDPSIFLAVGYRIPGTISEEIHWDLILLPRYDFPRKDTLPGINQYSTKILWEKGHNIAYDRYFGRGAIDRTFSDKKILIIGNGAIGSCLAEILARTGCNNIDLSDVEVIEPGNVCRSFYEFTDTSFGKSIQLKSKLESISPFLNVNIYFDLTPLSRKSKKFEETYNNLSSYEVIFDCTANNEIIQMLTDMRLPSDVYYISMSNKAREMVCVTNADHGNLIERRNQMLYSFGTFKEAEFREGTGCWHPTFEASYFDINQLLNFTVRQINQNYLNKKIPSSFYSYFNGSIIGLSEDIRYVQKELGLNLTIESKVLNQITNMAQLHFPNEFGGVLMGSYCNNFTELIISDIICPEKFKNGRGLFEANNKEINTKLKDYYKTYGNKVIYVGDWHSHPNGSNQFSQTDFNSIKKIAKSAKVNIENPILLVVSLDVNSVQPGFYVFSNGDLYKFESI